MLCAELMRGGGVGTAAIYRSKQQWPWREEEGGLTGVMEREVDHGASSIRVVGRRS